ncbi:MAG: TetR/AcrR family transcriptional regulator [Lentisphaerae bacterium]|nr:TetR/AcrR family transcriptional regulator [Lentisphaerota bacterium]
MAEKIGISEPALYRHFKNKAEIVRALIVQFEIDPVSMQEEYSGWELLKAFFAKRVEQVISEPHWANIIFSEELFIHDSEYSGVIREIMRKNQSMVMENLAVAMKRGEIRNDIAPEMVFRMTAGSLRLLIKQWGFSGESFDLREQSRILFQAWDRIWKMEK